MHHHQIATGGAALAVRTAAARERRLQAEGDLDGALELLEDAERVYAGYGDYRVKTGQRGAEMGAKASRMAMDSPWPMNSWLLSRRLPCFCPNMRPIATRLAKLAAGEADATLLAAAGLNRLGETGNPDWLPYAEVSDLTEAAALLLPA